MTNYRQILKLHSLGLNKTQIAQSCGCSRTTVIQVLRLAEKRCLRYPLSESIIGCSLLILDEWLLYPLKETEARDLLEIAESRYKNASTIVCSQFAVAGWREKIGDPILADAICDRIVHDSYQVVIDCKESMRKRKGVQEQDI